LTQTFRSRLVKDDFGSGYAVEGIAEGMRDDFTYFTWRETRIGYCLEIGIIDATSLLHDRTPCLGSSLPVIRLSPQGGVFPTFDGRTVPAQRAPDALQQWLGVLPR